MTYDTIRWISGWLPAALGLGLAILGGVIYGGMLLWPERNAARPRESSWSKTQTPGAHRVIANVRSWPKAAVG